MTPRASQTPRAETNATITRRIEVGDLELQISVPLGHWDEDGDRISFWYQVTRSALALSRNLQARGSLRGCRALELGCGLGLPGVTAGRLGAEVTFTDYQLQALEQARTNARANGVASASFRSLDWEHPERLDHFDLILGSEIVYDYFCHDGLQTILEEALAPGGTVLLADRPRLVVDRFLGRLVHTGFRCDAHQPYDNEAERAADRTIEIYCIYR